MSSRAKASASSAISSNEMARRRHCSETPSSTYDGSGIELKGGTFMIALPLSTGDPRPVGPGEGYVELELAGGVLRISILRCRAVRFSAWST